jgi:hypothetical protein
MEFEQRQLILQAGAYGRTHAGIQNELNEHPELRALKKITVYKCMALGRLGQTSADGAGRPGRPCDEGMGFSIRQCLEENGYSLTYETPCKLAVVHSAILYYLQGSLHMTDIRTRQLPHNFSSENMGE